MVIDGKKICPSCKINKPISYYTKSKWHKDGLYSYCLECTSKRTRSFQSSPKGKKYLKVFNKIKYTNEKNKASARGKVAEAIKNGRLLKPIQCTNCGTKAKLNAHHENYNKPLLVVWLCDLCHRKAHNRLVNPVLVAKTQRSTTHG